MIRRRALLGTAAAAALLRPRRTLAANGTIPGAIRWDAWYGDTDPTVVALSTAELQAPQYQFRAPWFATPAVGGGLTINGNQQATIDAEIGYAASAGLKYWAYVWYGEQTPANGLMNAWALHQSSSVKANMNWCMLWQFSLSGSWNANIATYVSYFQQANYQTALTNRPLLYVLIDSLTNLATVWGGSWANVQTFFNALRAATTGAGLGSPYIIIMHGVPATGASIASQTSADAISNYVVGNNQSNQSWPSFEPAVETFWATMGATGTPMIPIAVTGWDPRPRVLQPAACVQANYVQVPTGAQLTAHLQAAVSYVVANGTQCPSKAILIYSWDEYSEGGNVICPTYGIGSGPDTGRITALQGVTW